MAKTDTLGDRMKKYENITRFSLPPRTYTILRVDGRAFHTWTKKLTRPYDNDLMTCMDAAATMLCEQISGSRFAYVQSDEISVLAVDFLDINTQPWFDGVVQKWVSVGASIASVGFNLKVLDFMYSENLANSRLGQLKRPDATFDARVYTIPDFIEVENYFVWRQKDAVRNSVTMLAQAYASHKQLQGKTTEQRHEIIHAAGDNWAKHPVSFKHGRVIRKRWSHYHDHDVASVDPAPSETNSYWFVDTKTPVFTRNRDYLRDLIPLPWENDVIVRKAVAGK